MPLKVGEVAALFRYPVKSMAGERLEGAELGWHGLSGDRRLALRRLADGGGFPWLQASKLPDLVRFAPVRRGAEGEDDLPTHVRTPEGQELDLFGEELAMEVSRRHGGPVQMMHLNRGIFDEGSVSLIASATIHEVGRLAGLTVDARRFRPNVLIASLRSVPFEEDEWVGGVLSFGQGGDAPAIVINNRDERCSMVSLDPDTARPDADVLKAIVRVRHNKAGVYGAVLRGGRLAIEQSVFFTPVIGRQGSS